MNYEPSAPLYTDEKQYTYRHLTKSQTNALETLTQLYPILKIAPIEGIRTRVKPLLIGPSGSGKTAVVNSFCERSSLPMYAVCTASWVVAGAGSRPHTLAHIGQWVHKNSAGCIFLDELDKLSPGGSKKTYDSSWMQSVFSEVLSLLDSDTRLLSHGWPQVDIHKLRSSFILIGAGAWQYLCPDEPHLSPEDRRANYVFNVKNQSTVPKEISSRFGGEWTIIDPPNQHDYLRALIHIHRELDLPKLSESAMQALTLQAVQADRGMRWLEDYCTLLFQAYPDLVSRYSVDFKPLVADAKITLSAEQTQAYGVQILAEFRRLATLIPLLSARILAAQQSKRLPKPLLSFFFDPLHPFLSKLEKIKELSEYEFELSSDQRLRLEIILSSVIPPMLQEIDEIIKNHSSLLDKRQLLYPLVNLANVLCLIARLRNVIKSV